MFTFGVGVWIGIVANQTYEIPKLTDPVELWEKAQKLSDDMKKQHPELGDLADSKEVETIMAKLKELEQKYRKD